MTMSVGRLAHLQLLPAALGLVQHFCLALTMNGYVLSTCDTTKRKELALCPFDDGLRDFTCAGRGWCMSRR
jgi:hypothetical protein